MPIFKNCCYPQMEKIKKQLQKLFKKQGFAVIVERNI